MTKVTAAVRRAANELERREHEVELYDVIARAALSEALSVKEIAPIIDPTIVEPLRSKVLEAWRLAGLDDGERWMAEAETKAEERASALRTMILGDDV